MNWFDLTTGRWYETPQDYVNEALRFDDVREGGQFALREADTGKQIWFRLERGKAVQLPQ